MAQPIKLESFRDLVESGALKSAQIVGQKGGFAVVASVGMQQRPLATRRGEVRMFTTTDTAARTLRSLGVYHASLDMTNYEAGTLRPARPDTAQKNRAANAALEHDTWFRAQVSDTLDAIKDGSERLVDSNTMWNRLQATARAVDTDASPSAKSHRKAPAR